MANAQMKNTAEDMRAATEQGMDQAKKGVESFMGAAQEQAKAATASATDLGQKVLSFTERNISATLQFGQRLMKAKDFSDVTRLQSEFLSAQTQALTEQVRELTEVASRAMKWQSSKYGN
ncbi:MAG TPA: phasin family protein [Gemmatimonadales bacterium]|nr:phasin family protein [Gemmatimonadales bacterium]